MKQLHLQKGFTLIEMLVIAPIVILAIGAFLTVIISMTGEVLSSRASNNLSYNLQDALNRIEQDVKQSTSYLAQNSIVLNATEQQGYNNDATNFNNIPASGDTTTGNSLILNMVVTNNNPTSPAAGIVYLADQPYACASDNIKSNKPLVMNVVYFVKDNTLWRRTILPSNIPSAPVTCSSPWQQASCASGYTAGNLCKTNDIKLIEGVSAASFNLDYYTNAGSTTPNTVVTTNPSVDVRNAAFYAIPTVNVSISATQSVAGRTVERSASIRATRLETNTSLIAPAIQETSPTTPTITGTYISNETTQFTWPISQGNNVIYDVDFKVITPADVTLYGSQAAAFNAKTWTTGLTGTTNTSYTKSAVRNETVYVQVRARNTAGTTGYVNTSVKIPLWTPLVLQNTWANYAGIYSPGSFTRTSAGTVVLQGLIARASAAPSGETIAVLPVGYRPSALSMYPVHINGGAGWLYIYPDGRIESISVNAGWTSLNGITFIASDAGFTTNPITLTAPWVYYGNTPNPHATPGYTFDGVGRVYFQGLIKSGSAGSVASTIPVGTEPPVYAHIPLAASGTFASTLHNSTGAGTRTMAITNASSTYTALTHSYWPAAARGTNADCTLGWCTLATTASWVNYDGVHQASQYTKGSDGLVSLRGLIKNGTVTSGTTIATLPQGYRPTETLIFENASNSAIGRLDVYPDGTIRTNTGISNAWLSLDNIKFMADQ